MSEMLPLTDMSSIVQALRERPGEYLVREDGAVLFVLVGPNLENIMMVVPPVGKNFNDMTDEETNDVIIELLS